MRIQRCQHAVNGRLDKLFVGDVFDVIRPDALKYIAEQVKLPVCLRVVVLGCGGKYEGDASNDYASRQYSFHHYPLTLFLRAASDGIGLIG